MKGQRHHAGTYNFCNLFCNHVALVSNSSYVDGYYDPSYDHRSFSLFFSENKKIISCHLNDMIISQPWPSSFPYPTAAHAPLAPSPSRQNRAPRHGRRGVRLIRFNSSRGGCTSSTSIVARDSEKYPPHSTINRRVLQPATPLPRPVRRVRTARHITGDASYA